MSQVPAKNANNERSQGLSRSSSFARPEDPLRLTVMVPNPFLECLARIPAGPHSVLSHALAKPARSA